MQMPLACLLENPEAWWEGLRERQDQINWGRTEIEL